MKLGTDKFTLTSLSCRAFQLTIFCRSYARNVVKQGCLLFARTVEVFNSCTAVHTNKFPLSKSWHDQLWNKTPWQGKIVSFLPYTCTTVNKTCQGKVYIYMITQIYSFGLQNYTHKNVQVVTKLLSSRYQDVFALLVPSCCDKSDEGNRFATSCTNKSNTDWSYNKLRYELVVINLLTTCYLQPDDIRLVGTTCCESVGLINLVKR
jgi:hypothetical protein